MSEVLIIGSLECELNRKAIKNLHIAVLPPMGKVRVSAPKQMTDIAIHSAVASRLPWIRKQQQAFLDQPRQSERQMLGGEAHYLWGKAYRLKVITTDKRPKVEVDKQYISLYVKADSTKEDQAKLLEKYYRQTLKDEIDRLLTIWQAKIAIPERYGVKRMKTKWGSCNTQSKAIWLNLELIKKPHACLEYILVHELVHLLERHHNAHFRQLMDEYLHNWQQTRDLLNSLQLSDEKWEY